MNSDQNLTRRANDVVISVNGLAKSYRTWESPGARLKGTLSSAMLNRAPSVRAYVDSFALRDVNFSVLRGEAVGIIGRNGSGKSTLLQIIAGTLPPTAGTVDVIGRVGALLELGSGFNPEFTGRENVALYASLLGRTTQQAAEKLPEILSFSEIGEYLERPIKTYSTGMVVRLAFAVQTAFLPEILIVDEALSVGDIFFQRKCFARIETFLAAGGTLLFVTHDTGLVQRICGRCLLLEHGVVVADASPREVVKEYYRLHQPVAAASVGEGASPSVSVDSAGMELRRSFVTGDNGAYIRRFILREENGPDRQSFECGEWAHAFLEIEFLREYPRVHVGIGFRDRTGTLQGGWHNFYSGESLPSVKAGHKMSLEVRIKMDLPPGEYLLLLGIAETESLSAWKDIYSLWDCAQVTITGMPKFWGRSRLQSSLSRIGV